MNGLERKNTISSVSFFVSQQDKGVNGFLPVERKKVKNKGKK
jgi:hypothetical protein